MIRVPDIGGSENVPVIELAISEGDEIDVEDTLITLESDKASMDVPSPYSGKLVSLAVKEGDSVSEGDLIGSMEIAGEGGDEDDDTDEAPAEGDSDSAESDAGTEDQDADEDAEEGGDEGGRKELRVPDIGGSENVPIIELAISEGDDKTAGSHVHAGPAVRMLARELGVDLAQVTPTGPKKRVLKEDVQGYVKNALQQRSSGAEKGAAPSGGAGIPAVPDIDFSQFGEVEEKPMGSLMKAGAANLHRSWLNVPHVTQFDEADITELEAFRKSMKDEAAKQDAKLTPLPFMIKACAYALQKFPQFNVSLKSDGETLVQKHYVHIGIAVDTPDGLMVPVIRNADQKSLIDLAKESVELAGKAQSKKLKREEMSGGCFTISSLGSIGGTAFTPIVNAPEVAILGVSKAQTKPVWDGAEFAPRLMMPLSLSYDHRAVNGADAARFTAFLAQALSDMRRLLM
ncbi:dihydrolipoyllysine-residue acetyltransferase [Chromohalobacter canadensis]|uniref:dihydrolipoyllysine-residue acetyltransferase n=1 Tax=Chromohalobacter canadensis TaxID=141389 RepID=UPI0021C03BA6|nr:dihydrolipoyllysine-residue acetyltransferase [Chromohalobacter canadensis]